MQIVQFSEENLLDQAGNKIKIKKGELLAKCLENADFSVHVVEIVRHTLAELGYELDTYACRYRKSILFHELECAIVSSEKYQENKNHRCKKIKRESNFDSSLRTRSFEMRLKEHILEKRRRPGGYSMKAD